MSRLSMSLPSSLVKDLDYVSSRMGITRSSLVTNLLSDSVPSMRVLLEGVPEDPNEIDSNVVRRLRGESGQLIEKRLSRLKEMGNDMLS